MLTHRIKCANKQTPVFIVRLSCYFFINEQKNVCVCFVFLFGLKILYRISSMHACITHTYTFQIENQSSLCKCMVCDVYLRLSYALNENKFLLLL